MKKVSGALQKKHSNLYTKSKFITEVFNMAILSDCHLHTSHSGDSDTPMESMILEGISKGLHTMCFTEHMDIDYVYDKPEDTGMFDLNTDTVKRK